jgi:hypothetical protein
LEDTTGKAEEDGGDGSQDAADGTLETADGGGDGGEDGAGGGDGRGGEGDDAGGDEASGTKGELEVGLDLGEEVLVKATGEDLGDALDTDDDALGVLEEGGDGDDLVLAEGGGVDAHEAGDGGHDGVDGGADDEEGVLDLDDVQGVAVSLEKTGCCICLAGE